MGAASHEGDVLTMRGKPAAVKAAHAAGSHHCDAHAILLLFNLASVLVYLLHSINDARLET
jgi:hypothetical protein